MTIDIPKAFQAYEAVGTVEMLDSVKVVAFVESNGGGTMTRNGRHALIVTCERKEEEKDLPDTYVFAFPQDPEQVELFVQGVCQHWPALARYALLDADE